MGELEETEPELVTQTEQRDIPDHHPQYIMWEKKEKGGTFGVMVFFFPSHHHVSWGPALLEMAGHLPACEKQSINSLFGFACVREFCFPIKLPLFQPTREFSSLSPSDSLPSPAGGAVSKHYLGLDCWLGLSHNTFPSCRLTKLRATQAVALWRKDLHSTESLMVKCFNVKKTKTTPEPPR